MKVGLSFVDKNTGKKRKVKYSDVKYDLCDWADASKYLPADFDLLYLKTKDKTYVGWSQGKKWDGLNVPKDINVLYWKFKHE